MSNDVSLITVPSYLPTLTRDVPPLNAHPYTWMQAAVNKLASTRVKRTAALSAILASRAVAPILQKPLLQKIYTGTMPDGHAWPLAAGT